MSDSQQPAAPASGDPEIEALLAFEPVPRKLNLRDGWTADLQRRLIRLIVETGTPQRAARRLWALKTIPQWFAGK